MCEMIVLKDARAHRLQRRGQPGGADVRRAGHYARMARCAATVL